MKRLIAIAITTLLLLGCTHEKASETTTCNTEIITDVPVIATTAPTESTEAAPEPEEIILSSMTLEEKVGQLFVARCPQINTIEDIQKYSPGGYILFSRDFEESDPLQMVQTTASYQSAAKIPMLIAVDEEGGSVCRISCFSAFREKRFSSPRKLFSKGGMEAVIAEEKKKCALLNELGINVNMAPVCDISTQSGAFMYSRSLGQDPEITAQFISQTVSVMQSSSIGSVLKHFPGYGNNTDTHTGIAVDDRSLQELQSCDLIPFAAGIQNGCGAILVSHTIVNAFDSTMPASLSPAVHDYLRNEMNFAGVIVTDDLDMQAITKQYGVDEAAVLAVLAGNDLICTGSYAKQHQAIIDAVSSGRIPMELIDNSVLRILRWKLDLGLIESDF